MTNPTLPLFQQKPQFRTSVRALAMTVMQISTEILGETCHAESGSREKFGFGKIQKHHKKGNPEALPRAGWTPFPHPFNIAGSPPAALPAGLFSNSLPAGLQIAGARHSDTNRSSFTRNLKGELDVLRRAPISPVRSMKLDKKDWKIPRAVKQRGTEDG